MNTSSQALEYLQAVEAEAATIPDLPRDTPPRSIQSVGIVGAGTMGGGIAMNFVNVGIPVVIVDASQDALDRGLSRVRGLYEASAAKGKLAPEAVGQRMGLLQGSLDYASLAQCDLVIEAVFEDMALKKSLCERLGALCKRGAIIATNTSTLDVDALAAATARPQDVVGMHFFSPANVMKLLEIVRGRESAPDVLATVLALGRRIGKTPVVSGVCYGFIGNRIAEVYMRENEFLMMEGATPAEIDAAIESPASVGMAMGPNRMLDMAGIDVGAKTVIEWQKSGGAPADPRYRAMCRALFESGHFGQKTGQGYYRYEGRTPVVSPETEQLAQALGAKHGIERRADISSDEIVERLLFPMINEAAKILEEGIAYRPGDIDVVWTAGFGFPKERGGPVFMADAIGLPKIVDRLEYYGRQCGDRYGYWTPSKLLADLARRGKRLSDWRPNKVEAGVTATMAAMMAASTSTPARRPPPLAGIRILDMTSVMLGPYATQMLGDYGADIVKIEAPEGDTTRNTGPSPEKGMAATFVGANRNKRSVVLDLKQPAGRDALLQLVDTADVLLYSLRPQKIAALGLAPETLRERNRRLIVVGVHGFAEDGPYGGKPAYDDIIQALCGFASLHEMRDGVPAYVPSVIADKTCGLFAAQAVLMALLGRGADGDGMYVEVPMLEAMVNYTLVEHYYGMHFQPPLSGPGYARLLTRNRQPYKTVDGFICVVPYTDAHWKKFFIEVGRDDLADDARFIGIAARTRNIDMLYALAGEHLRERTTAQWLDAFERLDIPAAPINRLQDLERDPHLSATHFFVDVDDPALGRVRMPGPPLRFENTATPLTMPPRLGEHTVAVLREAGMSSAAIDALLASRAAIQWHAAPAASISTP